MYTIDSSFSAEDSRHIINTQGLFRKYLKYDNIPVTYTPNQRYAYDKENMLYRPASAPVAGKMEDVMTLLNYYFGLKNGNPRANANFNTLYELLDVHYVGRFLKEGEDPSENHAHFYDHGHKSSASILYSCMNKYAEIDTNAITNELKNYDRPREMEKMIDCKGMACPLPVVNAKKAADELKAGDVLTVLVDNEIAVQNLSRFATHRGCAVN
jgi:TusA-related sulfurtransferase